MQILRYLLVIFPSAIVLAAAVSIGIAYYKGRALDAESKAFVDGTLIAFTTSRNKQELLDRASPELRENLTSEKVETILNLLDRLGIVTESKSAVGGTKMSYTVGSGSNISASYVSKIYFQNGDATFQLGLIKRDGKWMISTFNVGAQFKMQLEQGKT
jgi:hypothetical protein